MTPKEKKNKNTRDKNKKIYIEKNYFVLKNRKFKMSYSK